MADIKPINKIIEEISPYYKKKGEPEAEHQLIYESYTETLEPIYYFTLDLIKDVGFSDVDKLVDNFTAAPGSSTFQEFGQRKGIMQQQASKVLADIGVVLRGVLTNLYDLRDFKIRLEHYNELKSKKETIREASLLSLKQIWLDKVDLQKGQGAIHAMASGNLQFVTLRDAFLAAKDEAAVDKLDLNERVKRVLRPRIQEFRLWLKNSENELRKRYEIQRQYLKSQVNNLKLYSRWARPYLIQAENLEGKMGDRSAELINSFNRTLLNFTVLGKSKHDPVKLAKSGDLPADLANMKFKRAYYSCLLADFEFRAVPTQGGYSGKATMTLRGYVLNEDELKMLDQELEKSDVGEVLKLIQGTTDDSLNELQKEIEYFIDDKVAEKEEKEKKESSGTNPFLALFGYYEKEPKSEDKKDKSKPEKITKIAKDNFIEAEHIRKYAANDVKERTFVVFDVYKKAHGMPSYT